RAGDRGHATARGLVCMKCCPQTPAKRKSDVFRDTGVAFNRHIDRARFVWLQLESVRCGASGQLLWHRVKQHGRTQTSAIEALVFQRNLAFADVDGCDASACTAQSPHFEQVGEVAAERDRKPNVE